MSSNYLLPNERRLIHPWNGKLFQLRCKEKRNIVPYLDLDSFTHRFNVKDKLGAFYLKYEGTVKNLLCLMTNEQSVGIISK